MAFADRIPTQDFTLVGDGAGGSNAPFGLWSDGSTMWVSDSGEDKIYAYNLSTKARDAAKDFDTLNAAGNTDAYGLWSDGSTMWVSDPSDNKIYAYNLSTKARDSAKDFDTLNAAGNRDPYGLWSDGSTMWVSDRNDGKIYAYNLLSKARDSAKDFDTLNAAGNMNPWGLWSDGSTMWVSDPGEDKIYAYNLSTKARDAAKDFDTLNAAGNTDAYGLWSDGSTMWVSDDGDDKIYAYELTDSSVLTPTAPQNLGASVSGTTVSLNWDSVSGATKYNLWYWTSIEGWVEISNSLTSLSYTHTNLVPGRTYFYQVRAGNPDADPEWGPYSNQPSVTIPTPPTDLMPTAPNISNRSATVGTSYSQTLAVGTGGDTPLSYSASGLPPGLSFNSSSRVISGTPTTAGTYNVTYTVTDADGDTDADTFNIVVSAAPPTDLMPSAPNIGNQVATVGTSYSQTLAVGSGGDSPLSYSASGLPPGLSFNSSSRVISGVPTTAGTYNVTYTVTDADGDTDADTFNIVVSAAPPTDLMPSAPNVGDQVATVGTSYSQTLAVGTGGDTPLSYSATGLPPGLTFNSSSRVISGVPTTAGTYTVMYTVTDDDGDSDTDTFVITVAAAPVDPDPIGWSSPTRLDSIADLLTIFDRADTGSSGGAWTLDTAGSTTSGSTGPGTNSGAPYVYSETSSGSFSTIPVISTLTVKSTVMTAWTGADRQMLLRAAIQGAFSAAEGLEVEGRAADSDDWTRIELLEGWAYSASYVSGGTVTDAAGDTQTFSQVGGWVDFAVTIPDAFTQVRIHTLAISGGQVYQHDIALWRIELLDGTATPSDQYDIGDVLRLDSIDDFDLIFARFNTTDTDAGVWIEDSGGSTPTSVTGPGTNSSGPYVFTESSGATSQSQLNGNSVATVLSTLMTAWVGSSRIMAFRASIAGSNTFSVTGGFVVEGRVLSSDSWSIIELVEGWDYSATGYTAGGTLTDRAGDSQSIEQDGGWVDYEVTIPDDHTQVRIRMAAKNSSYNKHDLALWNMELRQGGDPVATTYKLRGSVTAPAPVAAGRVGYSAPLATTYKLRGSVTAPAPVAAGRIGYEAPSDQYDIGDVLRLDSIDDFDLIFARFNTTGTNAGVWVEDSGGSTPSAVTGPATNSSGPYVFTEASGASNQSQLNGNSVATVLSSLMAAWVGSSRIMAFRASIAGNDTFSVTGGFMVEGRVSSSDSWSTIELVRGWVYSDSYQSGGTVTDQAGETQTFSQDGGWVDYEVTIPDDHTEVRIRMDAKNSSFTRHDLALWNMELRQGGAPVATTYNLRGSITAPAPVAAGRVGYTDDMVTVPLTVPEAAEILPALAVSIDGAARWPGGLWAEVESYRASMFGGPDAATLNVSGPEPGLRWLLSQLRRPVLMRGRQAGPVWWGFVQRVELRLGAILVTASLDGYRTAIAVQYLRDGQDLGLRSMFQVEQPSASQYGQIELLGAQEVEEPTAERLAGLLDPYLKVARGVEVSRQPATGARVYCRGWSAALEWRHVPRYHENASYGDNTNFADGRGQYTGPHSFSTTSDSEWAAWMDFEGRHPGYEMYISSVRVRISGPDEDADSNSGYSNDWHASIWERARTSTGAPTTSDPPSARLGDEIDFSAAGLPRVPSPIPSPPPYPRDITDMVEFDFSQQDILLPEAGFFVVVRGTLTSGFRPAYRTAASASWRWTRTSGSWGDASDTRQASHDFFTRCRGQGLLRLLLDGHDILSAGPAPGDVGERSYAIYLEGVSTVANHVQQVQDAEELGYVIDPGRGVHFFESGRRTFEMGRNGAWRTPVARGSMAFLGQYVALATTGERAICEAATFTPRTGLWDLSFRALPTAGDIVTQRRSAQRIARQGPGGG